MYKYKVVYLNEDKVSINIELEASAVKVHKDRIAFLDEHGEEDQVFNNEDIIVYYTILYKRENNGSIWRS